MEDARTGKRFPLELPIRIHTTNSPEEQAGITANVSASGVFLRADVEPQNVKAEDGHTWREGSAVEFDITLPADVIGAEEDVRVHCRGRVVRVEKIEGEQAQDGVACVIDKYEFVRKS